MEFRLHKFDGEPMGIVVDENSKEDFMKIMGWNESDWRRHMMVEESKNGKMQSR